MSATVEGFSTVCARCDGPMVVTQDAVGHDRLRCPKCDGVSKRGPRHPDDAMLPQGLVRVAPLPMVQPGQLRCQRCARGVDGTNRFCAECRTSVVKGVSHECGRCHGIIPPRAGRPPNFCDGCLTPAEKRRRDSIARYNERRGAA